MLAAAAAVFDLAPILVLAALVEAVLVEKVIQLQMLLLEPQILEVEAVAAAGKMAVPLVMVAQAVLAL